MPAPKGYHHRAQIHHVIPGKRDLLEDLGHYSLAPAVLREPQALDAQEPVQCKHVVEDEEQLREVPLHLERARRFGARQRCQRCLEAGFSSPPPTAHLLRLPEADLFLVLLFGEPGEGRHVGFVLPRAAHYIAPSQVDADHALAVERHRRPH
jgi:hypothetical protein